MNITKLLNNLERLKGNPEFGYQFKNNGGSFIAWYNAELQVVNVQPREFYYSKDNKREKIGS